MVSSSQVEGLIPANCQKDEKKEKEVLSNFKLRVFNSNFFHVHLNENNRIIVGWLMASISLLDESSSVYLLLCHSINGITNDL